MSQNIAGLTVELGINAGAFLDGIDKATYKSKQAAKDIAASFTGMGKDIAAASCRVPRRVRHHRRHQLCTSTLK